MASDDKKLDRRGFVADGIRVLGAVGLGGVACALAARKGLSGRQVWQIDPDKCVACGHCQTHCVLDVSAVKCVNCFALCGYCDVCTGYFPTKDFVLETGAENQLCPTGAIARVFIEGKGGRAILRVHDRRVALHCLRKMRSGLQTDEWVALFAGASRPVPELQRMYDRHSVPDPGVPPRFGRAAEPIEEGRPRGRGRLVAQASPEGAQAGQPRAALARAVPEAGGGRMKSLRMLLFLVLSMSTAQAVRAADLIPVPDFANHEIPQTRNPAPRADLLEYLDLGAVALGLCLASYLALVRRSRRALFLLTFASLAWLGFWRNGCICSIGAIQNVTLALFDKTYVVPTTAVALLVLPLVFTLFFGRTFCAAVCPLGAIQEIVAVHPVKVPTWLDHALGLLAYIYLGAAMLFAGTGTAFIICRYDPFVGLFRLSAGLDMLLVSAGFLVVGIFVGRPYCRYLCPYGVLLGLLARVAWRHVRIPPQECIQCRLCEDACPYGAIREPTVTPPPAQRRQGRRRLAVLILLLPVMVALGAWLGRELEVPLSKAHPTVRLAERMRLEETGVLKESDDASDAFRNTGQPVSGLYSEARQARARLGVAGMWFGAWVGLVLGAKWIHLSVRRRRTDYQPDPTRCVSCGRCFWYCPSEQARQGWIRPATQLNKDA